MAPIDHARMYHPSSLIQMSQEKSVLKALILAYMLCVWICYCEILTRQNLYNVCDEVSVGKSYQRVSSHSAASVE